MAAAPPSLRGPLARPMGGGNGGALPVARAFILSAQCGVGPAAAAAGQMFLRAGEPPCSPSPRLGHKVLSWGEGDHNHPLPTQNSGSLPTAGAMGGVPRCPDPESDHRGSAAQGMGHRAATGANSGQGAVPRTGREKVLGPAPVHQGGSGAAVLTHGRASSEVT